MKYRIIISLIIFISSYLWPAGSADSAKTTDKNKNSEPGTEIVFFADDFEKNVEKWIMSPGWKVIHHTFLGR